MEYWKEIIGIVGGLLVIGRLIQMGKTVVTKNELKAHCETQQQIIEGHIRIAVLKAMNEWLKENGKKLRG